MPRRMPKFDAELKADTMEALGIVKAGEMSRISYSREWRVHRLESLYELAYLRIFSAWEMYQEYVFLRSLCGYESKTGQEKLLKRATHYPNLAAAETAMLGGHQYKLWHNPNHVVSRCQLFIATGLQEAVISSNLAHLSNLAAIRHRIVHSQNDAKLKFNTATMTIASQTYPASRPGRFLRDWDGRAGTPERWLEVLGRSLIGLLGQMV